MLQLDEITVGVTSDKLNYSSMVAYFEKNIHEIAALVFQNQPATIKLHQYLSDTFFTSLSLDKEVLERCSVVHLSPFKTGSLTINTKISFVHLPNCSELVESRQRECVAPLISDFLSEPQLSSPKCRLSCNIYSDDRYLELRQREACDVDDDERIDSDVIWVDLKCAHTLAEMDKSLVKVRMVDERVRHSRIMKLRVSHLCNGFAILSRAAWTNLGGTNLSQHSVTVKKIHPEENYRSSSYDLSASTKLAKDITLARLLTCPIYYDVQHLPDVGPQLKDYFKHDRYLRRGDNILLSVQSEIGDNLQIPFIIKKIDGSDEAEFTYRINSSTAIYEGMVAQGYPPLVYPVTNLPFFSSYVEPLRTILSPFMTESRSCSPLPVLLLTGTKGSGKTDICKHIAQLFTLNLIEMNSVHLVADTVNSTELRIKDLLARCHAFAPILLHLRNINVLNKEEQTNTENPRIVETIVHELTSTIERSDWPLIVILSANNRRDVSGGIRNICLHEMSIESPSRDERESMIQTLLSAAYLDPSISPRYFSEHTAGFIYGDIKTLVATAKKNSLERAQNICISEYGGIKPDLIAEAEPIIMKDDLDQALATLQKTQSKDLGAPKIPNVVWDDIGGLEDVKDEILDTIQLPLDHPELFESGLRRSGILLYGPPGTGKTLLAKAVATECSLNFFSVKGPELINMYVGQSEENVRCVFEKARAAAPCVVFFDELDSLAPARGRSGDSGGVLDRVVSQLLAELDGLHKSCDVFVIGATNRPDLLDSALLRPGRFDRLVFVNVSSSPDQHVKVLKAVTRKFELAEDCDLFTIAEQCPKLMSGADLYAICSEAVTCAIMNKVNQPRGQDEFEDSLVVSLEDFKKAMESFRPSISQSDIDEYRQLHTVIKSG